MLNTGHTWGWGARRVKALVGDDFMTRESGAAELLVLEFQPPHTAPCLWLRFGSSGGGSSAMVVKLSLGRGPGAPTPLSCRKFPQAPHLKEQDLLSP